MSRQMPNRGAGSKLYELIRQRPPGTVINTDEAYALLKAWKPSMTRQAAASALSYLRGHGKLLNGGLAGNYTLAPTGEPVAAHDPVAVIDSLLAAMAAAEPLLHEAKEILGFMHRQRK